MAEVAMADDQVRGFLGRWSRLKHQAAAEAAALEAPLEESPDVPASPVPDAVVEPPPLESLNFESDYRGFLGDKVDEGLKRAALKKLFHTEHFNTMDGLDVYTEDFSVFEPMSRSMVEQLAHSRETLSPTLPEGWFSPAVPAADAARFEEETDAVSAAPEVGAAAPDTDEAPLPRAPDLVPEVSANPIGGPSGLPTEGEREKPRVR
jgi:hypothetical protein